MRVVARWLPDPPLHHDQQRQHSVPCNPFYPSWLGTLRSPHLLFSFWQHLVAALAGSVCGFHSSSHSEAFFIAPAVRLAWRGQAFKRAFGRGGAARVLHHNPKGARHVHISVPPPSRVAVAHLLFAGVLLASVSNVCVHADVILPRGLARLAI